LQDLAAPGRASHPTGPPTPGEPKPTHTRKDISDFYTAKRLGKVMDLSGRMLAPEEVDRIEAEIFAATREGRIIG
jgi:hypothetical protein